MDNHLTPSVRDAMLALREAGADNVTFNCGRVWFEVVGKGYCLNTDYQGQIKPDDLAWAKRLVR